MPQKSEQGRHICFIIYLPMLGVFVIFFRLGDRDMWTGNESEAAVVGWDMVETGRILVPHILDRPFVDNRPPGAYWLHIALGVLTWSVRRAIGLRTWRDEPLKKNLGKPDSSDLTAEQEICQGN